MNEKICPFQSDSHGDVYCSKERCMVWGKKNISMIPAVVIEGCRLIP